MILNQQTWVVPDGKSIAELVTDLTVVFAAGFVAQEQWGLETKITLTHAEAMAIVEDVWRRQAVTRTTPGGSESMMLFSSDEHAQSDPSGSG